MAGVYTLTKYAPQKQWRLYFPAPAMKAAEVHKQSALYPEVTGEGKGRKTTESHFYEKSDYHVVDY